MEEGKVVNFSYKLFYFKMYFLVAETNIARDNPSLTIL